MVNESILLSRALRVFYTGANPLGHELVMDDWIQVCQLNNKKTLVCGTGSGRYGQSLDTRFTR